MKIWKKSYPYLEILHTQGKTADQIQMERILGSMKYIKCMSKEVSLGKEAKLARRISVYNLRAFYQKTRHKAVIIIIRYISASIQKEKLPIVGLSHHSNM